MLSDFRKTYLHMVKTGLMSQKKAQKGKVQIERESFRKSAGKQRVLIFQGGAALGSYEAGAYKALYNWIKEEQRETDDRDENIFDIVAGTSIGAINAAIIVSHVMENKRQHPEWSTLKCWEGSAEKLEEFWKDTQTVSRIEAMPLFLMGWESWRAMSEIGKLWFDVPAQFYSTLNPFFKHWYEQSKEYFGAQASSEAARRYFSIPQFLLLGAHNVFSPLAFGIDNLPSPIALPKMDYKFYNNSPSGPNNLWFRYSNEPLKNILKTKYITSPVATSETDPRLLVIAIDVQEGKTVAFDSYPDMSRKCRICSQDFNDPKKSDKKSNQDLVKHVFQDHRGGSNRGDQQLLHWSVYGNEESGRHAIFYDQGVGIEQILASASVPVNYNYTKLEATEFSYNKDEATVTATSSATLRYFWDGQYINNTPLREVINEHQRYWIGRIGSNKLEEQLQAQVLNLVQKEESSSDSGAVEDSAYKVPDLAEVYIINLWPSEEKNIPQDRDGQLDRKNDVLFHDKTEYDEKVAELVNDYIKLTRKLIDDFAPKDPAIRAKLWSFLQKEGSSKSRSIKKKNRQYKELLQGGFIIDKVVRIERTDDPDAISEKWADYSSGTISRLFEQGYNDTKTRLDHTH
jgi:NTE family protein